MSIDWNTAPEGATHWEPTGPEFNEGWMKKEGNGWFFWGLGAEWKYGGDVSAEREATFEARPQDAWDGQGLPPVGTLCEWHGPNSDGPDGWVYTESNVVAYTDDGLFICMQKPGCWPVVQRIDNCEFRPIRTPEQIAAEEREKAIEEMCFAEETLTVKQAKALYEAGYRRQEEEIKRNADRYLWLRNPDQDVSLVLDKVSGEVPADEFGCGGYRTYEYRSGDELDAAIDAAMERRT